MKRAKKRMASDGPRWVPVGYYGNRPGLADGRIGEIASYVLFVHPCIEAEMKRSVHWRRYAGSPVFLTRKLRKGELCRM